MGNRDSSQTRVKPVFDELFARDPSGMSWLAKLLRQPRHAEAAGSEHRGSLSPLEEARWGNAEKSLEPPRVLLQWLVCCADDPGGGNLGSSPTTRARRRALLQADKATIGEALALLARPKLPSRDWYILEGPTRPDVFLQTPEAIVVIEGKRTEAGPTTCTTWMRGRHQMLRHLDCAWEIRGNRKVLGFFIVEGDGGPEAKSVPPHWVEAARVTISDEALKSSLPHRTQEERTEIARCFLGATTWQAICEGLDLEWSMLPESVGEARDDV